MTTVTENGERVIIGTVKTHTDNPKVNNNEKVYVMYKNYMYIIVRVSDQLCAVVALGMIVYSITGIKG